jgi:hypothetical protein
MWYVSGWADKRQAVVAHRCRNRYGVVARNPADDKSLAGNLASDLLPENIRVKRLNP